MNKYGKNERTKNLVIMSVFTSIIIIQTLVPFLGFIPLGVMNATIIHITVIIGAIMLGPKYGAGLGLVFGLCSMWKNTFMPNPTSFVFSPFTLGINGYSGGYRSLIVCLLPRVLIGVSAYYVYSFFQKLNKRYLGLLMAGVVGSMVNTILVMSGIYLLFAEQYALATNKAVESLIFFIIGIIGMQGVPEAIVSSLITFAVAGSLLKYKKSLET
ncbi:MAG: ECF transporter S component [Johnsonella sp.]|nr:ECF transporter S component [Johnsonella sp.]